MFSEINNKEIADYIETWLGKRRLNKKYPLHFWSGGYFLFSAAKAEKASFRRRFKASSFKARRRLVSGSSGNSRTTATEYGSCWL